MRCGGECTWRRKCLAWSLYLEKQKKKKKKKRRRKESNWQRRVIIIISPGVRRWARVPGRRPKINIPGDSSGTLSGNARCRQRLRSIHVFRTLRPAPMCLFRSFDALQTDQVWWRICVVAVAAVALGKKTHLYPGLHHGNVYVF